MISTINFHVDIHNCYAVERCLTDDNPLQMSIAHPERFKKAWDNI